MFLSLNMFSTFCFHTAVANTSGSKLVWKQRTDGHNRIYYLPGLHGQ